MKRKRYGWGWKNEERSCALNSVLQKLYQADRPHSVYSLVDYHACNSSVLSSKSRGKKTYIWPESLVTGRLSVSVLALKEKLKITL